MQLVGNDDIHSEEVMRDMWKESMKSVACTQARITYENFLLLMKGQTKDPEPVAPLKKRLSGQGPNLVAVPEGEQVDSEAKDAPIAPVTTPTLGTYIAPNDGTGLVLDRKNEDELSMHSLPNIGSSKDNNESSSSSMGLASPGRDGISPVIRKTITELPPEEPTTPGLSLDDDDEVDTSVEKVNLTRRRSYSLTDKEGGESPKIVQTPQFGTDSRRAVALPEHDSPGAEFSKNKSALVVNRQLYRAHRQMRIAVMDASRRFEEQQARRARDTLIARKEAESGMGIGQAGLVMRHGTKVQVTSEAIRKFMEESKAEQQVLVEKANRRGGRGRSSRKKTISDMSGMLVGSMGQDELGEISKMAASKTPDHKRDLFNNSSLRQLDMPSLKEGISLPASGLRPRPSEPATAPPSVDIDVVDAALRGATIPGQFRKTADPFGTDGMYGGARINSKVINEIRSERNSMGDAKPRADS